jgi:hypothetical protein
MLKRRHLFLRRRTDRKGLDPLFIYPKAASDVTDVTAEVAFE